MKIIRVIFYPYMWWFKRLLFSGLEFMLVLAGMKSLDDGLKEYEFFIGRKENIIDLYIEWYYRNAPSTKDDFD